ncbi:MAG: hypothetical protein ACSHXK_01940 [Oceanococcus sp.]
MSKLASVFRSYTSMPAWVQVWVLILMAVNVACVAFLDTAVGGATAAAGIFVILTNMPIMLYYGGMNRAMAIPHLFAWIPLSVFLLMQLCAEPAAAMAESVRNYAIAVLVINGISLAFDVVDTLRWLKGERETPGINA